MNLKSNFKKSWIFLRNITLLFLIYQAFLFAVFAFDYFYVDIFYPKKNIDNLIESINNSPPVHDIYKTAKTILLDENINVKLIDKYNFFYINYQKFNQKKERCYCNEIINASWFNADSIIGNNSFWLKNAFVWYIEKNTNPGKCFDYYYNNFKIGIYFNPLINLNIYKTTGIDSICLFHFSRTLDSLKDNQLFEFVYLMEKEKSVWKYRYPRLYDSIYKETFPIFIEKFDSAWGNKPRASDRKNL